MGSLHHAQLQKNLRTQERSIEANHNGARGKIWGPKAMLTLYMPAHASPCQPVVWHSHAVSQVPKNILVLKEVRELANVEQVRHVAS